MKKLLLSGSIVSLLLPGLAFAAYNDVSLTTDAVLSVNGITINVSGSDATIESIAVGATTFTVTLADGSSFYVVAPSLNELSADTETGMTATYCDSSSSALAYTATGALTVVITPSATLCASAGGGSSPSSSSSSSSSVTTTEADTTVAEPAVVTPTVQLSTPEAIAAIKTQLIALIQELIAMLIQQLQVQIQELQASGSY